MNFKRKFRRKDDTFIEDSIQYEMVRQQIKILEKAVGDLFKLKVDKRIKKGKRVA